jgi:hypothetical protein
LTHASKRDSKYRNNVSSYRKLTDLLTRGRIAGRIPWQAIDDEIRSVDLHAAFWNTGQFFRQQFGDFLKGYWRNRQQSQPHHIEIVAEKLTVRTILQNVAQEYTIPLTIYRGMSSLPPKKAIAERYRRTKKEKLILLVVSDLDPAGDAIAEDLVKSDGFSLIGYWKAVTRTISQYLAFDPRAARSRIRIYQGEDARRFFIEGLREELCYQQNY